MTGITPVFFVCMDACDQRLLAGGEGAVAGKGEAELAKRFAVGPLGREGTVDGDARQGGDFAGEFRGHVVEPFRGIVPDEDVDKARVGRIGCGLALSELRVPEAFAVAAGQVLPERMAGAGRLDEKADAGAAAQQQTRQHLPGAFVPAEVLLAEKKGIALQQGYTVKGFIIKAFCQQVRLRADADAGWDVAVELAEFGFDKRGRAVGGMRGAEEKGLFRGPESVIPPDRIFLFLFQ